MVQVTKKPAKVKIEWLKKKMSLSQAHSAGLNGLEYCFVSKEHKQCCPFVLCEDFLQDAVMAMHHGKAVSIYGFQYDPKQYEPISVDRMKMVVAHSSDKKFGDKIPNMLEFLHCFERKLRLIRTGARRVDDPPKKYAKGGVYLLDGSSRWLLSPPMLSMYTLLIRVGFTHKAGDKYEQTVKNLLGVKHQTRDVYQLKSAQDGIEKILKYGYPKIFFKDPTKNFPDINVGSMHSSMGICAFTRNASEHFVKHWHRDLEKPKKKKKKAKTGAKT
jgi:hypothetical protein